VKNAQYLHIVLSNAIDSKIRQASEYKFERPLDAPLAAPLRELYQRVDALIDGKSYAASSGIAVMFSNVIANLGEVAGGGLRPADMH
jgi:hypothetical protein